MQLTATYDKDSKKYHRYIIDHDEDSVIVGNIYIRKGQDIPKEITIRLRVKETDQAIGKKANA